MVVAAHPGRHGDLLWALPTLRELTRVAGGPARLDIPVDIAGLEPLLSAQPYITTVIVRKDWHVEDSAPRRPITPPGANGVHALGYRDWPLDPLPYEVARMHGLSPFSGAGEDSYFRPWIEVPTTVPNVARGMYPYPTILVQWTDRYCELKLGILSEIRRVMPGVRLVWCAAPGSRMAEAGAVAVDWLELAERLTMAQVMLTDCSAAHVLAAAIGVPNILVVEPETDRHHEIFWPGSLTKLQPWQPRDTRLGRTIRPVLGTDGKPTFDSRHVIYDLTQALERA